MKTTALTFPNISSACSRLREDGWKPVTENPREWKRVRDHMLETATLSLSRGRRVRVEFSYGQG